jgi:hypothetical protein
LANTLNETMQLRDKVKSCHMDDTGLTAQLKDGSSITF